MPKSNRDTKSNPRDTPSWKDYIHIEIDYWQTYHHHKEQMAYAASALFLTGSAALTFLDISRVIRGSFLAWIALLGIVKTTAILGGLFIFWQLRNREIAAHMLKACGLLLARWLTRAPGGDELAVDTSLAERPLTIALRQAYDEVRNTYNWFESPTFATVVTLIIVALWGIAAISRIFLGALACLFAW